jgi:hypothetical protein
LVYVVGFPAAVLVWAGVAIDGLMRSLTTTAAIARAWAAEYPLHIDTGDISSGGGGSKARGPAACAQLRWLRATCRPCRRGPLSASGSVHTAVDESPAVAGDAALAPLVGGVTKPHLYWTSLTDLALRCAVSVPLVVWRFPSSTSDATGKLVTTVAILVASAWLNIHQRHGHRASQRQIDQRCPVLVRLGHTAHQGRQGCVADHGG